MDKKKKKLTWVELERHGLDKRLYGEYCDVANNIEGIFQEALELFEHNFICQNTRSEFKNLFQLSVILDNEIEKAQKIADIVLTKADEIKKAN